MIESPKATILEVSGSIRSRCKYIYGALNDLLNNTLHDEKTQPSRHDIVRSTNRYVHASHSYTALIAIGWSKHLSTFDDWQSRASWTWHVIRFAYMSGGAQRRSLSVVNTFLPRGSPFCINYRSAPSAYHINVSPVAQYTNYSIDQSSSAWLAAYDRI